ncbi:MAG TPA: ion channel [Candidatus Dormibacteraeota bacterium]|nr:ion channel [Candidatus Dormibacteraeota bacterium]
MTPLGGFEVAAGVAIVLIVFYDLFQSVVLPRPAVGKIQLARILIRPGWLIWRWVSRRTSRVERSEARLAYFAPLALLGLFVVWALALTLAYGLLISGLGDEFRPAIKDIATAIYVSASTLVPLSFGDFVPEQGFARFVIIAESATGVALAALAITLLFTLYESFRDREEAVISLDALAGAPPSGLHILETAAAHHTRPELQEMFDEWRKWSARVLESHLAYPLLVYFRSSHDNEAWINSFGAVMDAATLVMSSVEDDAEGAARLMFTVGNHLVEDLTWVLRLKPATDAIVERDEFDQAVARLKKAGYQVKDGDAWNQFVDLRSRYASTLNQVAHLLAVPTAEWVGDRSYLPHRQSRALRQRRRKPTTINP